MGVLAASLLLASPAAASVDYTIDSQATCEAFLSGIGGTGSWDGGQSCYVRSGTLPSGDTLTVTGSARFRPQTDFADPTAVDFRNEGTITFDSAASGGLYNAGRFENAGTVNFLRPSVQNYGTLDNSGVITMPDSAGIFSGGTLRNSGTFNAAGSVQNAGTVSNTATGTVTATGVWSGIGSLSNAGSFTHSGTSTMSGPITNTGTFTHNAGSLALQGSNSGTFQNFGGTATVSGTFSNSGAFVNASGAVVAVSGTFTNECTGTISGDGTFTGNPVVDGCNTPPVAVGDSYSTAEGTTLTVGGLGVLGNDTDADDDPLTAVLVTGASNGTMTLNPDGSFSYTPNPDFTGPDSFTYKANDGTADSNTATVTINVNPVNHAPAAVNDSYVTQEDTALTVGGLGVLGNDTDADDDPLTAVLVTGASNGTMTLNPDGSFSYTPSPNFHGSDSFTYKANDGTADSNTATVTINVSPVNDAPTVRVAPSVCTSDTAATGRMLLILADIDSPVSDLSVDVASSNTALLPDNRLGMTGTADVRTLSVAALAKKSGTSTVTVLVSDDAGASASQTINVAVGSSGGDILTGSSGVDMLFGLAGANTLLGLADDDLLCGGNGADTLDAGSGDDVLTGGRGPDRLLGADGDDHLTGGRGGDFFSGGTGDDTLADLAPSEGDTTDNT